MRPFTFWSSFFFLFYSIPNPLKNGQREKKQVGGHGVSSTLKKTHSQLSTQCNCKCKHLLCLTKRPNAFMKRREIRNAIKKSCQRSCNPGYDYTIQNHNEKNISAYNASRFGENSITVISRGSKYRTGADTTKRLG